MLRPLLGAALLASVTVQSVSASLPPVRTYGSKFFAGDNQFFLKGVAYQGTPSDPLIDVRQCQLDAELMKSIGANSIRVYHVDPAANHDACMAAFDSAGIYIWLDLDTFDTAIVQTEPQWTQEQMLRWATVMDAFQQYANLGGFWVGNEVINTLSGSPAAPYIKAATADMKDYMQAKGYRQIPIGYSAADIAELRPMLQNYLACGDSSTETIDFFGLNSYEWCGDATFQTSGYQNLEQMAQNYSIPIFFSETGCNVGGPRTFNDQKAIFGPDMGNSWSGSIIYEWVEETNHYGLVTYPNGEIYSGAPIPIQPDFDNLASAWKTAAPPSLSLSQYSTRSLSAPTCPAATSGWVVNGNFALPRLDSGIVKAAASGNLSLSTTAPAAVAPASVSSTSTSSDTKITDFSITVSWRPSTSFNVSIEPHHTRTHSIPPTLSTVSALFTPTSISYRNGLALDGVSSSSHTGPTPTGQASSLESFRAGPAFPCQVVDSEYLLSVPDAEAIVFTSALNLPFSRHSHPLISAREPAPWTITIPSLSIPGVSVTVSTSPHSSSPSPSSTKTAAPMDDVQMTMGLSGPPASPCASIVLRHIEEPDCDPNDCSCDYCSCNASPTPPSTLGSVPQTTFTWGGKVWTMNLTTLNMTIPQSPFMLPPTTSPSVNIRDATPTLSVPGGSVTIATAAATPTVDNGDGWSKRSSTSSKGPGFTISAPGITISATHTSHASTPTSAAASLDADGADWWWSKTTTTSTSSDGFGFTISAPGISISAAYTTHSHSPTPTAFASMVAYAPDWWGNKSTSTTSSDGWVTITPTHSTSTSTSSTSTGVLDSTDWWKSKTSTYTKSISTSSGNTGAGTTVSVPGVIIIYSSHAPNADELEKRGKTRSTTSSSDGSGLSFSLPGLTWSATESYSIASKTHLPSSATVYITSFPASTTHIGVLYPSLVEHIEPSECSGGSCGWSGPSTPSHSDCFGSSCGLHPTPALNQVSDGLDSADWWSKTTSTSSGGSGFTYSGPGFTITYTHTPHSHSTSSTSSNSMSYEERVIHMEAFQSDSSEIPAAQTQASYSTADIVDGTATDSSYPTSTSSVSVTAGPVTPIAKAPPSASSSYTPNPDVSSILSAILSAVGPSNHTRSIWSNTEDTTAASPSATYNAAAPTTSVSVSVSVISVSYTFIHPSSTSSTSTKSTTNHISVSSITSFITVYPSVSSTSSSARPVPTLLEPAKGLRTSDSAPTTRSPNFIKWIKSLAAPGGVLTVALFSALGTFILMCFL